MLVVSKMHLCTCSALVSPPAAAIGSKRLTPLASLLCSLLE